MAYSDEFQELRMEILRYAGEEARHSLWIPAVQVFGPLLVAWVAPVSGSMKIALMVAVGAFWIIGAVERAAWVIHASVVMTHYDHR